ncbi:MAG: HAD family hydrolase [Bacteroidales bacterium]|jgi:histidinol-phosphate phosphatase family protein|nr:HAD family hydrolase [Bacteroidales bacterium]MDN5349287.1 D-glycero-D-manno-heptose 1,7-bisphosphate phosphatase [Bacteroidales bacterium]
MPFSLEHITQGWTLFLDRDGVINVRPYQDYVKKPSDFQFLPGVKEAIALLRKHFKYLIIITNQQGIGKGLMTEQDLIAIHNKMQLELEQHNGKIDAIYFCSMLAGEKDHCRKPEPFMALKAKEDFPDIEFTQSIMAGDSSSDLLFGQNLGMKTIQIGNNQLDIKANFLFPDLLSFAKSLDQKQQPDVA